MSRLFLAFSSLFLLVSCTTTGLYGVDVNGENVVFLLDVSPSMEGVQEVQLWKIETKGIVDDATRYGTNKIDQESPIPGIGLAIYQALNNELSERLSKLGGAKRALSETIDDLPPTTNFTILTFSFMVSYWQHELVPATGGNKLLAKAFLSEINTTFFDTNIAGALKAALSVDGIDEIYLITDGDPTDASPSSILKKVRNLNTTKQVRINTIGLGQGQNADFLNALATENRGIYVKKML